MCNCCELVMTARRLRILGRWLEPGLIRTGVRRKVNCESRAQGSAALDRNLFPVRLRTPTHQSETEAPTDFALCLGSLCSRKRVKYVGLIFRRYHRSIVVHGHLRLRGGVLHRDGDWLVWSSVFD